MHDWTILRSKADAGVKVNAGLNTNINFFDLSHVNLQVYFVVHLMD